MVRRCPHTDILGTGAFHAAYRYESVELKGPKAKYLTIYETDNPDPPKAREEAKASAECQRRGSSSDGFEMVSVLTALRIWPMD